MKIKFKLYFSVPVGYSRITEDQVAIFSRDMSEVGYATLYSQEMEVEIPEGLDMLTPQIDTIRLQQEKIRAEAEGKIQQLEHTVQTLLALPAPENGHD